MMKSTKRFEHETPHPRKWELAGYEPMLSITEKSNPITCTIDKSDSVQIVQLLKECDAEIFQKEDNRVTNYKTLYSESILRTMVDTSKQVQELLKDPEDNLIVLSGCGTSGRLAFLLASSFNNLFKTSSYGYIIAGGDKALITSQELPEDNPEAGINMLIKISERKKKVMFIGISCGLSAPFVAGQLDVCMNNLDKFIPVLVGFNPINMARPEKIDGWHSTFLQVAERIQRLEKLSKAYIINPAVGPEGIAGSSRMKGGSATKILLETIFLAAHKALANNTDITDGCLLDLLRSYEKAHSITYSHNETIAAVVKQAGASLQQNGHIYYIGWKSLGVMGIIDASECVPTFGADFSHVRGFINNGFKEMANNDGDMSTQGPEFAISHEDFLKIVLPTIHTNDTIVFIFTLDEGEVSEIEKIAHQIKVSTDNLFAISHGTVWQHMPKELKELFSITISVTWPVTLSNYEGCYIQMFQRELSTKWILNAISTGAHVLKGKVYYNYMIDLKVSNSKLFGRALYIIQMFTGQTRPKCFERLLQAIYETDELSEKIKNLEISKHIQRAATMNQIVPAAMVALMRNCPISEAKARLASCPIVREAISEFDIQGQKWRADQTEAAEDEMDG
ncbi:glucokinase regulatory protein isoform X2 [Scyliorhinus canicula]|nr:glucokinase regulatory protein isoform X2 [Scyliorhinus canicula]XP_038655880.1 glucokinase regulatory protein isoform X2 [Scyliorhinus canicula]